MQIVPLLFLLVRLLQVGVHAAEGEPSPRVEGLSAAAPGSTSAAPQAKLRRESTSQPQQLDALVADGLPTIPELQVGVSALGSIVPDNADPLALTSALSAAPSIDDVLTGRLDTSGFSSELPEPENGLEEMVSELHKQVESHQAKASAVHRLSVEESAHAAADHLAKVITADPDPGLVSQMSQSWLTDVGQEVVDEPELEDMSHHIPKRAQEVEVDGGRSPELLLGVPESAGTAEEEKLKQQLKEVALHGKPYIEEALPLESETLVGYRWNSNTSTWEEEPGQQHSDDGGQLAKRRLHLAQELQPTFASGPPVGRHTFEELDRNRDGLISWQEYHQDADPRNARPPAARDAFEAFDRNRDGLISWKEYRQEPTPMASVEPDYYVKAPDAAANLEALLILCHRCQDEDPASQGELDSSVNNDFHSGCQKVRAQCAAQQQAAQAMYRRSAANSTSDQNNSAASGPVDLTEAQQVADKTLAMEKEILHESGMSDALEVNESVDEDVDEGKAEVYGSVVLVGGIILMVAGVALGMEIAQSMGASKQKKADEEASTDALKASDLQEDWPPVDEAEEVDYADEAGDNDQWGQPGQ